VPAFRPTSPRKGLPHLLGPDPPRQPSPGLATRRAGSRWRGVARRGGHHPRRHGPRDDREPRTRHPHGRYDQRAKLQPPVPERGRRAQGPRRRADGRRDGHPDRGRPRGLGADAGTGAADVPQGAFRHGLRQAQGPAAGEHLHHRGEPGHLDLLPLGHGPAIRGALPRAGL
ncbi:MAG: Xanthine-guanine phosphoribosyltransferase, partial [uncultured Rubellimicrobium sp.]